MQSVLGVAGMVLAAAITPGPNNLVVLRTAARAGMAGALPAIAGIVGGGLVLLAAAAAGAGALYRAEPRLQWIVAAGGCLYLSWLGIRLMWPRRNAQTGDSLPSGGLALFGFQFLNPKAWVMVLTASSATSEIGFPLLAALFALIPLVCLLAWSALGSALSARLSAGTARWLDRAMGALLVASAIAFAAGA
jgi:threonine/homoserine/homoserine lactone efflux protein